MGNILNEKQENYIDLLIERYSVLNCIRNDIEEAYNVLEECYSNSGKLLIAGNGGSAADSEHIVGELMKGFRLPRRISKDYAEKLRLVDANRGNELAEKLQGGLPAIALTGHNALTTAYANDVDGVLAYAQQLNGYGTAGDVFLGISTSGNSKNIIYAAITAKAKGLKVIGLTGEKGGELADFADVTVKAPEMETYMIQELHLPIYHCWCLMLENKFFGDL